MANARIFGKFSDGRSLDSNWDGCCNIAISLIGHSKFSSCLPQSSGRRRLLLRQRLGLGEETAVLAIYTKCKTTPVESLECRYMLDTSYLIDTILPLR